MTVLVGDVLAQPAPERLDRHQVRAVAWQRHDGDVQACCGRPHGAGAMVGCAVPDYDQPAGGNCLAQATQDIDRVRAVGARVGPDPDLTLVVEIEPVERDLGGQPRRGGGDVEGYAAYAPAVAEVDILMDMGLIEIDQVMAIALRAVP